MDFRRNSVDHPPLTIDSSTVERVGSTKFLGVHITEDLTWTTNTTSFSKKAQQRLHFLRRLKRASLPPPILTTFYRGTIESVLTSCITVWYGNCSVADRKTLQRTVNTAAKIIGAPLPSILDIFLAQCSSKSTSIVKDPTHPSHILFQLLPSGRRYRSIRARSARLLNGFFPQAVRALNSNHLTPLWNLIHNPSSWNQDSLPPIPPHHTTPHHTTPHAPHENCWKHKNLVQFWVCYKPPVETHSFSLYMHQTLSYKHSMLQGPNKITQMFTCECITNHIALLPP